MQAIQPLEAIAEMACYTTTLVSTVAPGVLQSSVAANSPGRVEREQAGGGVEPGELGFAAVDGGVGGSRR